MIKGSILVVDVLKKLIRLLKVMILARSRSSPFLLKLRSNLPPEMRAAVVDVTGDNKREILKVLHLRPIGIEHNYAAMFLYVLAVGSDQ